MRNVEPIRRAMHAQPFRPFGIKLVDGSTHTVTHPDFIAIPPGMRPREVTFYATAGPGSDDYETHWIDLGLILEVIVPGEPAASPTASASGNGE
jgi:hypothetical protein